MKLLKLPDSNIYTIQNPKSKIQNGIVQRRLLGVMMRSRLLLFMLLASLLLSGCVQYDVGVKFDNPNSGEIVQHIKLGERLTSFSGDSAQEWYRQILAKDRNEVSALPCSG